MSGQPIVIPLGEDSFRPHLILALLDWCEAEGYTPYMQVVVDDWTSVPREYVNDDGTIVLCVSTEATSGRDVGYEQMTFKARFGERSHNIVIPLGRIQAIFPKENPNLASLFNVVPTPEPGASEGSGKASGSDDDDDLPIFTKL